MPGRGERSSAERLEDFGPSLQVETEGEQVRDTTSEEEGENAIDLFGLREDNEVVMGDRESARGNVLSIDRAKRVADAGLHLAPERASRIGEDVVQNENTFASALETRLARQLSLDARRQYAQTRARLIQEAREDLETVKEGLAEFSSKEKADILRRYHATIDYNRRLKEKIKSSPFEQKFNDDRSLRVRDQELARFVQENPVEPDTLVQQARDGRFVVLRARKRQLEDVVAHGPSKIAVLEASHRLSEKRQAELRLDNQPTDGGAEDSQRITKLEAQIALVQEQIRGGKEAGLGHTEISNLERQLQTLRELGTSGSSNGRSSGQGGSERVPTEADEELSGNLLLEEDEPVVSIPQPDVVAPAPDQQVEQSRAGFAQAYEALRVQTVDGTLEAYLQEKSAEGGLSPVETAALLRLTGDASLSQEVRTRLVSRDTAIALLDVLQAFLRERPGSNYLHLVNSIERAALPSHFRTEDRRRIAHELALGIDALRDGGVYDQIPAAVAREFDELRQAFEPTGEQRREYPVLEHWGKHVAEKDYGRFMRAMEDLASLKAFADQIDVLPLSVLKDKLRAYQPVFGVLGVDTARLLRQTDKDRSRVRLELFNRISPFLMEAAGRVVANRAQLEQERQPKPELQFLQFQKVARDLEQLTTAAANTPTKKDVAFARGKSVQELTPEEIDAPPSFTFDPERGLQAVEPEVVASTTEDEAPAEFLYDERVGADAEPPRASVTKATDGVMGENAVSEFTLASSHESLDISEDEEDAPPAASVSRQDSDFIETGRSPRDVTAELRRSVKRYGRQIDDLQVQLKLPRWKRTGVDVLLGRDTAPLWKRDLLPPSDNALNVEIRRLTNLRGIDQRGLRPREAAVPVTQALEAVLHRARAEPVSFVDTAEQVRAELRVADHVGSFIDASEQPAAAASEHTAPAASEDLPMAATVEVNIPAGLIPSTVGPAPAPELLDAHTRQLLEGLARTTRQIRDLERELGLPRRKRDSIDTVLGVAPVSRWKRLIELPPSDETLRDRIVHLKRLRAMDQRGLESRRNTAPLPSVQERVDSAPRRARAEAVPSPDAAQVARAEMRAADRVGSSIDAPAAPERTAPPSLEGPPAASTIEMDIPQVSEAAPSLTPEQQRLQDEIASIENELRDVVAKQTWKTSQRALPFYRRDLRMLTAPSDVRLQEDLESLRTSLRLKTRTLETVRQLARGSSETHAVT
ncbi:hypothetical protein HY734_03430 [Candidatus Uhrbacteria bacterium]|nr:hypothetical protein [Candidatus Uhrbacteria bacterium]